MNHLLQVLLILFFLCKFLVSMTYYGKPCWDDCKKKGNSEYHYCTGITVYDSKIQKASNTKQYCSPNCGKTAKGFSCKDDCRKRGNKPFSNYYSYYWCNDESSWDYCSLTSCSVEPPKGYKDCTLDYAGKTVWFEYLYYPGYWLAKGYANKYASLWKAGNNKTLLCPDQGYGWNASTAVDGHSVYLKTIRPGYKDYYFIGMQQYEEHYYRTNKYNQRQNQVKILESNVAFFDPRYNKDSLNGLFAFRIMCKDCDNTNQCVLLRAYDEKKLYTNRQSALKMCKYCGSADWFEWRVYSPSDFDLTCTAGHKISQSILLSMSLIILSYHFY